ncbi:MAG: beta-ketoacyl-ACP synthase III [Lachnospiraceae bacterium]|nr:beta-ketoacyl-ACP synthase III [Lachnospiraceae bacterium]
MFARITGTGSYLPQNSVDNFMISKMVDTSDEWIKSRTGICSRHIAEIETVVDMSVKAAEKALECAKLDASELDMVVVSSVSAEQILPCVACEVQAQIGAVHAVCFDLNAACAGFMLAYQNALAQIKAGTAKKVLLIGAERLSNIVNWQDRGTCILFGDGAGAVILEATQSLEEEQILAVMHSDGSAGKVLTCNSGIGKQGPYHDFVCMDGREIYKFAVRQVPKVIKEVLTKSDQTLDEIDYFLLHQANSRIIEGIAKRLRQDIEKFPMNLMNHGNMSSASIPVLLDDLNRQGRLKRGMKLVIAGFGAGLTWGGMYLQW